MFLNISDAFKRYLQNLFRDCGARGERSLNAKKRVYLGFHGAYRLLVRSGQSVQVIPHFVVLPNDSVLHFFDFG